MKKRKTKNAGKNKTRRKKVSRRSSVRKLRKRNNNRRAKVQTRKQSRSKKGIRKNPAKGSRRAPKKDKRKSNYKKPQRDYEIRELSEEGEHDLSSKDFYTKAKTFGPDFWKKSFGDLDINVEDDYTAGGKTFKEMLNRFRQMNGTKLTPYRFVYQNSKKLTEKSNSVYALFVIFAPEHGNSLMEIRFGRKKLRTPKQWHSYIESELVNVFVSDILPAINNKTGSEWSLRKFIAYGLKPGLRKEKDHKFHRRKN